jgi:ABC-2 type transport system ATP-binding protein
MASVLRIEDLRKSYRVGNKNPRREAVDGLNLEVEAGQIFGLLGPNGAGKTTTLKCILGLVNADSGNIWLFGSEGIKAEARRKIGFLPEQPYFELYLTPRKLLAYYGRLFSLDSSTIATRTSYLLSLVGLEDEADLTLNRFSKGMLQRIGIAQALLNEPEFLLLDEPSSGLDPVGKIQIREILEGLQRGGTTILLSSHQLSEIEDICDSVAIMDKGRNVASGTMDELLQTEEEYQISLSEQIMDYSSLLPGSAILSDEDSRRVAVRKEDLNTTLRRLLDEGASITEVRQKRLDLEEFFMARLQQNAEKEEE